MKRIPTWLFWYLVLTGAPLLTWAWFIDAQEFRRTAIMFGIGLVVAKGMAVFGKFDKKEDAK
jgi:hypothetical protein